MDKETVTTVAFVNLFDKHRQTFRQRRNVTVARRAFDPPHIVLLTHNIPKDHIDSFVFKADIADFKATIEKMNASDTAMDVVKDDEANNTGHDVKPLRIIAGARCRHLGKERKSRNKCRQVRVMYGSYCCGNQSLHKFQ